MHDLFFPLGYPNWYYDDNPVTKVVFDPSFADARPTSTKNWFCLLEELRDIVGLHYLNTSEVKDMEGMFANCKKLKPLDLSAFDTRNVTNMKFMFSSCSSLTSLDLTSFDTRKVTDMMLMFYECANLTSIYVWNGWNTDNVTKSDGMFNQCKNLVGGQGTTYDNAHIDKAYAHVDGGKDNPGYLTKVTEIPYVVYDSGTLTFYFDENRNSRTGDKYALYTINSEGYPLWTTDHGADITQVVFNSSFAQARPTTTKTWFRNCTKLKKIVGIEYLNTSEVADMSSMFYDCTDLLAIDLRGFDTRNVENMHYMFESCSSLTSLDLSSFDTRNVTDMGGMFYWCTKLLTLIFPSSTFDTSNVYDMSYMFYACANLSTLDLSTFDTHNVTKMDKMFKDCFNLTTIYCGSRWNTNNVNTSEEMFLNCKNLVGGKGTPYDATHVNKTYARVDGGMVYPGYLTMKGGLMGDVNLDGSVDVRDMAALLEAILKGTTSSLPSTADVTGDKLFDVRDMAAILNIILGN